MDIRLKNLQITDLMQHKLIYSLTEPIYDMWPTKHSFPLLYF